MAWTVSKIFSAYVTDILNNTTAMDLMDDALIEAALFDTTITPDQIVTSANSAYGAGVWAANGITDTGSSAPAGWPSLGRPLASRTISDNTATTIVFDAADTVSANDVTTLAATSGCLLYDETIATPVANQGISFHYFGGSQTVTLGRFTIVWNASGILSFAL